MPVWDSEIEVDEELARALISEQFPSLDVTSMRRVGEGWDNTVWATRDGVAFRFPRRTIAIPGIEREIVMLPEICPLLPAPIPDAAYVGSAGPSFPWPWFGSRFIAGTEIAGAGLTMAQRGRLAAELGSFLGCLHRLRPASVSSLPVDPLHRGDMTARVPAARAAVRQMRASWDGSRRAELILRACERLPADPHCVLVHGDLNVRHVLISPSGGLAGVIDWGDLCLASCSVDLALYWSLFDIKARRMFLLAYGPVDGQTLARARVLALFFDATLVAYADDKDMPQLRDEALRGLARCITD